MPQTRYVTPCDLHRITSRQPTAGVSRARGRAIALAIATASCLNSCAAREGELTGDVFIVTRGGANYKLGLVTVSAYPDDVLQRHIDRKKAEASKESATLNSTLHEFRASGEAAKKEYDLLTNKYGFPELDGSGKADTPGQAEARAGRDKARALEAKVNEVKERLATLSSWRYYVDGLPAATVSAKTDADGKFKLTIPRSGKFALAAQASRAVAGSTEEYQWLVWVSWDGAETKQLMLSNDNLWGQESDQAVVKPADLPAPK